jgi:prepilin-type N-terminal cleavage/methylation domain-containing protein/prepilin-type processing-associated H-X9-DG protein
MTNLWHNRKAFTLVEVLVVIAIIAVLAALLLPALTRGKQRAQRIQCIGNLQEMGTAFQLFAHDHGGKFPMQTPEAEGGSEEFVTAGTSINGTFYFSYRHLQTLANELVVPRILVCPADIDREPAASFSTLQNSNVSYFVNAYADYNEPSIALAGDRNITNDAKATASLVRGTYGLRWTSGLHSFKGNVLFSDTHVEQLNNAGMDLPGATVANSVFFLPAVRTPTPAVSGTPPMEEQSVSTPAQNDGQPPAPGPNSPGNPAPTTPPRSLLPPAQNGMAGSTMASRQTAPESTFTEAHARETNQVAVTSDPQPAAAPAAEDDDEPAYLWLLGAARTVVAKASWWLLLLLALLIAAALYLYARRKMRARRNRELDN